MSFVDRVKKIDEKKKSEKKMTSGSGTKSLAEEKRKLKEDAKADEGAKRDSLLSGLMAMVVEIPQEEIIENPDQPRKDFKEIENLAASIEQVGLLSPVTLVRTEGGLKVVAGERRLRAFRLLSEKAKGAEKDKWRTIKAIIREEDDPAVPLIENLQRCDLTAAEKCEGLEKLKEALGTWDKVALCVGYNRSSVLRIVGARNLSEEAQRYIAEKGLSSKHIAAFSKLKGDENNTRTLIAEIEQTEMGGTKALARAKELLKKNASKGPGADKLIAYMGKQGLPATVKRLKKTDTQTLRRYIGELETRRDNLEQLVSGIKKIIEEDRSEQ